MTLYTYDELNGNGLKNNSIAMGIENLFMIILFRNKIFKKIPKSGKIYTFSFLCIWK
jgi:hypothetical protein